MDDFHFSEIRAQARHRQSGRVAAAAAEADLAMRLLIAALVLVLAGVVAASTLVQLGEFRSAEAADPGAAASAAPYLRDAQEGGRRAGRPGACVRLAGDDAGRCATRTEVADRLLLSRLAR